MPKIPSCIAFSPQIVPNALGMWFVGCFLLSEMSLLIISVNLLAQFPAEKWPSYCKNVKCQKKHAHIY